MPIPDVVFSSLSPAWQQLVRLMQSLRHGRLRNVVVRDGEPTFDPPPTAVRVVKLDRPNQKHPTIETADFPLRREVLDLVAHVRAMKQGTIERLEIVNGMPQLAEVAELVAPAGPPVTRPTSTREPRH